MKKKTSYENFLKKFKTEKTTDDCYTPKPVYEAVLQWAKKHLNIGERPVVRPFYPGGDYEHYDYPANCVVVDNPPFSIFRKIVAYFQSKGIDFLLFAPSLTSIIEDATFVGAGVPVVYENGANVNTSFVTNMLGDIIATSAPELHRLVKDAVKKVKQTRTLNKYKNPLCVLRASNLHTYSLNGVNFCVRKGEGVVVRKYSKQKRSGEFGNSILMSDEKVKERVEKERERVEKERERVEKEREVIQLSVEAKEIINILNNKKTTAENAQAGDQLNLF